MPPRKIKVVDIINDIEDVPQDLKITPSEQEIPETAPLEQDTPETVEEQNPVEQEPQPVEELEQEKPVSNIKVNHLEVKPIAPQIILALGKPPAKAKINGAIKPAV